jgi:putative flippase GtrA
MPEDHTPHSSAADRSLRSLLSGSFIRFLLVGVTNFIVSFTTFQLLLRIPVAFALKATISQLVSYSAGIVWSFYWNRRFTFRTAGPVIRQATRFFSLQVCLALISSALVGYGVDYAGLPATPVWLVVMAAITIVNFLASKWWAFK